MRLPLYSRILLWFTLNVAVIGTALVLVMRWQLRHGLDTFMGSLVSAKLQTAGDQLNARLAATPPAEWDGILTEIEQSYGVAAELRHEAGGHIAGSRLELPETLTREINARREPRRPPRDAEGGPPPRPGPPPDGGPDEFGRPQRPGGPDAFGEGPPGEGPRPGPGRGPGQRPRGQPPQTPSQFMKILVTGGEPERYWAAILLPPQSTTSGPPRPLMYVIATRSIFAGGLLFDPQPWLIGVGAALVFSALLWLPLVRGITGKIKETMHATEQMAQGKFDARVKENRGDELGRLAAGVNRMAQQLDGYVTGQKRFTGDIAHELCSPISRMQAALGILEARVTDEKQQRHIATLNDELQHMSHLVQELLQFSKASLHRDVKICDVVLVDLAHGVAAREAQGYPDDAVQVHVPDDLRVRAEPELLARAMANVIRNALRYAGEAGPITLTGQAQGDKVVITISDQGPGVPPEALPKLFDAFYRPDADRGRDHGGAGLGLAIVKSSVEACGGTVSVRNRVPSGLEITLVMPASQPTPV